MFIKYNVNPLDKQVGDCTVRAISLVLHMPWDAVHYELCELSRSMADMPSSNQVIHTYLSLVGMKRVSVPNECPDRCYTVAEFCKTHPIGRFILSTCDYVAASNHHVIVTGSHMIAVIDGNYYDTWDSGDEVILYYWS